MVLLEEVEIGEEGVGGQVYLGALEDYVGLVLVEAAQFDDVLYLGAEREDVIFLEGCEIS